MTKTTPFYFIAKKLKTKNKTFSVDPALTFGFFLFYSLVRFLIKKIKSQLNNHLLPW